MLGIYRWFTRRRFTTTELTLPVEGIVLRGIGLAYLTVFIVRTFTTRPYPELHGQGAVVLLALIAFVIGAVATQPQDADVVVWRRVCALGVASAAAAVLAGLQPNGFWGAAPSFIAIMAGMRLDRAASVLVLAASLVLIGGVYTIVTHGNVPVAVLLSAVPWFLVMRLLREFRKQHDALKASQGELASTAALAERGRLAREMHDVLAHSLSALALQLESTRMLARDRGADQQLTQAVDQAHHLAASGLEEARRAIAAGRGDALPGPERIGVLADAFGEQSGLPVAVEVHGEPRALAPDARLAVYRTAQEALTNVRRHATPERVEVKLAYLPDSTVLVVQDHAPAGTPPPVAFGSAANGYGLTGMRERAELLGGKLLAQPTGDGFRVELRLPA
ncbi:MAG TPA: histidine kinase [Solirubrobacteraceae bacterium]|nr:histidine kinase [Solirubrobacteraceae bacterium]